MTNSPKQRKLFTPCRKAFERAVKELVLSYQKANVPTCCAIRQPLYDERRKHTGTARYSGPRRYKNDDGLRSLCPDHLEDAVTKTRFTTSIGNANLWRHFGGRALKMRKTDEH